MRSPAITNFFEKSHVKKVEQMIQVACEKCGTVLRVAETMAGKRGRCQKCGTPLSVPTPSPDEQPLTVTTKLAAIASSPTIAKVAAVVSGKVGPAPEGRYPEIVRNAALVRWGAGLVNSGGWFAVVVGALMAVIGLACLATAFFSSSSGGTATAASFGASFLSQGCGLVVGGILLVALAAFFRLISHTCEAIRDSVICQFSSDSSEVH